jgi:hypothetical protein
MPFHEYDFVYTTNVREISDYKGIRGGCIEFRIPFAGSYDPLWLFVSDEWSKKVSVEDFLFICFAKCRALRAELMRREKDQHELDFKYGLEAKAKRRLRIKNPIKAIERLDARINNLVRYWNAYGCHSYLGGLIAHFNELRESLTKYRLDQEELAREAFKPSRVEYSLSCH